MKNKHWFFKGIQTLLIVLFFFPFSTVLADDSSFSINAHAALAVDMDTGKILYNQNGDERLGFASITKIISLYLVEKEIAEGRLHWTDPVSISEYAHQISVEAGLSNVALRRDRSYSVKELFDAAVIHSANAAVIALAEKVAQSEPAFVDKMKQQLLSWGIKDSFIVTSSGLNNEDLGTHIYPGSKPTDENLLSAKEIAIIAKHLIKDFPDFLEVSSTPSAWFAENTPDAVEMKSSNRMLSGGEMEKSGVDGLKTGTTDFAGACFVGTMTKEGQRIITVVLNATNAAFDSNARFEETSRLMDYAYQHWTHLTVLTSDHPFDQTPTLTVKNGTLLEVPLKVKDSISILVPESTKKEDLAYTVKWKDNAYSQTGIVAPIQENQAVATIDIKDQTDSLGYLEPSDEVAMQPSAVLVTSQPIDKANFIVLLWRNIQGFFKNIF